MKYVILALCALCGAAFSALPVAAKTVEYTLTLARQKITLDGKASEKITINDTLPGPTLRFTEGDEAVIHVVNTMKTSASVHWHGLIVPAAEDGAPGFNGFEGIAPGATYTYRFPIKQAGTYWYHSHTGGQEQDGLYGGIVIDPSPDKRVRAPIPADHDYVLVLSDLSTESAETILSHLKMSSDYYQFHRRTLGDFFKDAGKEGFGKALKTSMSWGKMRMLRTDIADVEGYHFLINGMTNAKTWTGLFTPGQSVRLRLINASAMTMYDVRIPGLKMTVVAADGQPVKPVSVDEFRIGNAETYDVIVTPTENKAYTIAAESIDRTGFALATLAPREGMRGPAPVARPRPLLTMADMNMETMMRDDPNMDMSNMDMESGWADTSAPKGARVLDYSDLVYAGVQPVTREPDRTIEVRLGGNMERYIWTLNGKKFGPNSRIEIADGERVRINFVNETMMAHPMHLHGMFFQLDNGQDAASMPNKHTVIVPPGQTVSVLLSGDNPGEWPLHCHLLYHMMSGMMTHFVVLPPSEKPNQTPQTDMSKMDMTKMDMSHMKGGDHVH
jgi:FtsP/CotA-like multicopper oxidase with cupredoxin domain